MENILKIRAHHLLCLQGFQGYGYNRDFVRNMTEIVGKIESDPEFQIITVGDDICSCCTYYVERECRKNPDSAREVKNIDMRVLEKLNLKDGITGRAKDFLYLTNTNLRNRSDLIDICGKCEWKEKCLWYLSRF